MGIGKGGVSMSSVQYNDEGMDGGDKTRMLGMTGGLRRREYGVEFVLEI